MVSELRALGRRSQRVFQDALGAQAARAAQAELEEKEQGDIRVRQQLLVLECELGHGVRNGLREEAQEPELQPPGRARTRPGAIGREAGAGTAAADGRGDTRDWAQAGQGCEGFEQGRRARHGKEAAESILGRARYLGQVLTPK